MEYIYATLTLNETGAEINEQNLTAVLEAADAPEVTESRIKAIVAALEDVDIDEIDPEAGPRSVPEPSPAAVTDPDPDPAEGFTVSELEPDDGPTDADADESDEGGGDADDGDDADAGDDAAETADEDAGGDAGPADDRSDGGGAP